MFLPPFGPKELGQFKNLIEKCPPGLAPEVVDYAVKHWSEFCGEASAMEGAFKLPQLPTVGTLLRFAQSAATSYLDNAKAAEAAANQKAAMAAKQSVPYPSTSSIMQPTMESGAKPVHPDDRQLLFRF